MALRWNTKAAQVGKLSQQEAWHSIVVGQEMEQAAHAELVASHSKILQKVASIMDAYVCAKKAKSLYCDEGCGLVAIINAIKADANIDHSLCSPKITRELINFALGKHKAIGPRESRAAPNMPLQESVAEPSKFLQDLPQDL